MSQDHATALQPGDRLRVWKERKREREKERERERKEGREGGREERKEGKFKEKILYIIKGKGQIINKEAPI